MLSTYLCVISRCQIYQYTLWFTYKYSQILFLFAIFCNFSGQFYNGSNPIFFSDVSCKFVDSSFMSRYLCEVFLYHLLIKSKVRVTFHTFSTSQSMRLALFRLSHHHHTVSSGFVSSITQHCHHVTVYKSIILSYHHYEVRLLHFVRYNIACEADTSSPIISRMQKNK